MKQFSRIARSAVFAMLAVIAAGGLASVVSLTRRERPTMPSVPGLAVNTTLIDLFWGFRFYALGFDQDTWAPR